METHENKPSDGGKNPTTHEQNNPATQHEQNTTAGSTTENNTKEVCVRTNQSTHNPKNHHPPPRNTLLPLDCNKRSALIRSTTKKWSCNRTEEPQTGACSNQKGTMSVEAWWGAKLKRRVEKSPNTSSSHHQRDLHGEGQDLDWRGPDRSEYHVKLNFMTFIKSLKFKVRFFYQLKDEQFELLH